MDNKNNNPQAPKVVPPVYSFKPKEYKPLDKKDIVFVLIFLVSCFIVVDFALFHYLVTGFCIAYLVFFAVTTAYIYKKAKKLSVFPWLCGALSVAGSVTFALFDDNFMRFLMLILMGVLFSIYCMGVSEGIGKNGGSFKMLLDAAKSVVVNPFENIGEITGSAKASAKNNKKSFGGVIGFVVAIPVLAVIIPLLTKSDAAFEGLITGIIKNIGVYLLELALAVILLIYVYPFAFGHRHFKSNGKSAKSINKPFPVSACVSFLSAISVVYVVYLLSQLAYFFSAFKGILPSDYHYSASAFARRGFFEMFAICVINILIVSVVSMLVKKKAMAIKLLSTFVSLFSVLLIVVAMQKMRLNISIFGLSKNRVLVTVFMLMLLVVFAFFILHIYAPKIGYIKPIIIICSVMFIALTYSNVDLYIARYNVNGYTTGQLKTLDVENISNMSSAAMPELVKLCASKDDTISAQAKRYVTRKLTYEYDESIKVDVKKNTLTHKQNNDFREYNWSKQKGEQAIVDYFNSLDEKGKMYFLTYYSLERDGYYDEADGVYYDYTDDNSSKCSYDTATGAYTLRSPENAQ